MEMVPVESNNVRSVGYDLEKNELRIKFRSGETYAYDGVPGDVHKALMSAESKGKFVNSDVKGKYDYRKL
jgi:KTSC domain